MELGKVEREVESIAVQSLQRGFVEGLRAGARLQHSLVKLGMQPGDALDTVLYAAVEIEVEK